jgi:hypothetical protein
MYMAMFAAMDEGTTPTVGSPSLLLRLQNHFGGDPARLPVIEQHFADYERPNLQLALDELLAGPERQVELLGIVVVDEFRSASLSRLSRPMSAMQFDEGPVEYLDVALPEERQLACVKRGLYLFRDENEPVALLIHDVIHTFPPRLSIEVMAGDRMRAELVARRLTKQTRSGPAYRGHVLSIESDCHGSIGVQYHRLPRIGRADIILPESLLRRIERHTLSFTRHAERLRAARRHIKRGILLHGSPGTGKTLTAMYLAAQMAGRTVLLITGAAVGAIETACKLARMLEPATVVLEDVDLIGTEREHQTVGANALLFELLNQMDGLAEDMDVLFLLTTNRPDVLEPALAARPGRIDQAIEVPLPDAECRRRLFDLYGRDLRMELTDTDALIRRTEGVSPAFIRELLRKSAVFAAEDSDGPELIVQDRHMEEALAELVVMGGTLTQKLLGAAGLPKSDGE